MKSKYPFKPILKYIPSRYVNLKDWQVGNQKLVYDFKKGIISDKYRQRILDAVKEIIGDDPDKWVVCFVPASTMERTERRFSGLAAFLQENLPCPVYLHSIKNFKDYEPVHITRDNTFKLHSLDREHFIGKHVVLIDDVITTGRSFKSIGDKLIYIGVISVYGVCFAMTIHPNLPTISYRKGDRRIRMNSQNKPQKKYYHIITKQYEEIKI